jgi:hypothetical protein
VVFAVARGRSYFVCKIAASNAAIKVLITAKLPRLLVLVLPSIYFAVD